MMLMIMLTLNEDNIIALRYTTVISSSSSNTYRNPNSNNIIISSRALLTRYRNSYTAIYSASTDTNNNIINDDDDDDNSMIVNITSFKIRQDQLRKANADAAYEDHDNSILGVSNDTNYFRQYAKRGLDKFKNNDIDGCIIDLKRARAASSRQPLMQLGIFLYINNDFENAEKELMHDIITIENAKINKASELRLWRSASLLKLGNNNDAMKILNSPVTKNLTTMNEDRFIMNVTMGLFSGDLQLEKMMQFIDDSNANDASSFRFYGNFYTALYLDAIGDSDLCKTFLSFAIATNPSSSSKDIWYHLPRMFYAKRFGHDEFLS